MPCNILNATLTKYKFNLIKLYEARFVIYCAALLDVVYFADGLDVLVTTVVSSF